MSDLISALAAIGFDEQRGLGIEIEMPTRDEPHAGAAAVTGADPVASVVDNLFGTGGLIEVPFFDSGSGSNEVSAVYDANRIIMG